MEKICPKCRGKMHTIERSGVVIDQCGNCRGIFLDRGELDQLMTAELAYYASSSSMSRSVEAPPVPNFGPPPAENRYRPEHDRDRDDPVKDGSYRQNRYDDHYAPRRKKRRSFLEELFD